MSKIDKLYDSLTELNDRIAKTPDGQEREEMKRTMYDVRKEITYEEEK